MCNPPSQSFGQVIQELIARRDGAGAVRTFVHNDPEQRYATWFNDCMVTVEARFIEKAYLGPQAVLAAKIAAGEVKSFAELLEKASAVLLMTALHFRVKSHHRTNPCLKPLDSPSANDAVKPAPRKLIVPLESIDQVRDPDPGPEANAEYAELQGEVLRRARECKRLPLQAYRRVREYEFDRGTLYGALRHVARMAVVDSNLRIVKFRRTADGGPEEPSKAIVRQVRRLFQEALQWVGRGE
jgi:hypothetical protein